MLLESLIFELKISVSSIKGLSAKEKRDESQKTSLFRALLELSGGKVDVLQHHFAEDCSASENSDLCASVFNMKRTNNFGRFNAVEMCSTLSKSLVFSGIEISAQDLENWTTEMKDHLPIGFPREHLVGILKRLAMLILIDTETSIAGVKRIWRWSRERVRSLSVSFHPSV